jgi:hypothetical protein
MKKTIVCVLLLGVGIAIGQQVKKIWVTPQYQDDYIRAWYMEDKETGTRCYLVQSIIEGVGASRQVTMNCVPKGK